MRVRRHELRLLFALAVVGAVLAQGVTIGRSAPSPLAAHRAAGSPSPVTGYGALPVAFEPNVGQAPRQVRFLAHAAGYALSLTDSGIALGIVSHSRVPRVDTRPPPPEQFVGTSVPTGRTESITLRLVGARARIGIAAAKLLPGIVNYLIGNDPRQWHTRIPTYAEVVYHDVYRGIDLVFHGGRGGVEYDWVVRPHTSPGVIMMAVDGVRHMRLDRAGDLVACPFNFEG
jgi:hypothetical protein